MDTKMRACSHLCDACALARLKLWKIAPRSGSQEPPLEAALFCPPQDLREAWVVAQRVQKRVNPQQGPNDFIRLA
jgi:hypothetical protein